MILEELFHLKEHLFTLRHIKLRMFTACVVRFNHTKYTGHTGNNYVGKLEQFPGISRATRRYYMYMSNTQVFLKILEAMKSLRNSRVLLGLSYL